MLTKAREPSRTVLHSEDPRIVALLRDLYTRVLITAGVEAQTVLGVSSALNGEGKTTIATGLASMLASDGILAGPGGRPGEILLVECNQGAPGASQDFALEPVPGLMDHLRRECEFHEVVKRTPLAHLWVVPVGSAPHNFSVLIRSARMHQLMQRLRERFACIILDLPSVLATTDTQVLAGLTTHLLLVVRSGVTPARLTRQAIAELDPEKLVGLVLNDRRPDLPGWLDQRQ